MVEQSYGVIPFRKQGDILIVQDNHNNWGFPKGHHEVGEKPRETAARELLEETGLEIEEWIPTERPLTVGYYNPLTRQDKKVEYFPALIKGEITLHPKEMKAYMWMLKEDLIIMLKFKEFQEIIPWIPTL